MTAPDTYPTLRRAAFIAEGIMGKRASQDDPLAYWTLINTLLEIAYRHPVRPMKPAPEDTLS